MTGIAVLINSMGSGGAEKVTQILLKHWAKESEEPLYLFVLEKEEFFYEVDPRVKVIPLPFAFLNRWSFLKPVAIFLQAFALAFFLFYYRIPKGLSLLSRSNVTALLSRFFNPWTDWIITEHNKTDIEYDQPSLGHRMMLGFIRLSYPTAKKISGVSEGVVRSLDRLGVLRVEPKVIYNPVEMAEPVAPKANQGFVVCMVARLAEPKDHKTLIRAFLQADLGKEKELLLVGDGPLRQELEDFTRELDGGDQVRFLGFVKEPFDGKLAFDLFVLSSCHEGFGLVLLEAMAMGVPVVSSDCPGGPGEILERGRWGEMFAIGDVERLAEIMESLYRSPKDRGKWVERGSQRVRSFSPAKIAREYEDYWEFD